MKNRIITFILAAVMLAGISYSAVTLSHADIAASKSETLDIKSNSCYLADYETGTVMFEKNANEKKPIASMVKIMTLLLSLEHIDSGELSVDSMIRISENASSMGGSQAFLDANNEYAVDELLKSIVVASANDSCVAMAETIAGSVEGFVEKMNDKAISLGMSNTNFVNCTGLPAPNQYSCAKDVAIMTKSLLSHKLYYKYSNIWMYDLTHPSGRITGLNNTNKLIRFYEGCDGGKTGFTNEAMFCLSATAKRNGMRVISVVVGAPDSKTRFAESSKLFNYAFANFESKQIVFEEKSVEERIPVKKGISDSVASKPAESFSVFSEKGKTGEIEQSITYYNVKAPVKTGDSVGKLAIFKNGECIKEIELLATENIKSKNYMDFIKDLAGNW